MDLNKAYVLDIESNNLLANMLSYKEFPYRLNESARLWCVVIRNVGTNEVFKAELGEVTKEWMRETLKDCEYLIAHNGIKFDFIALQLFGVFDYRVGYPGQDDTLFGNKVVFLDTLIMSRLFNPDRYNGHSLESWGERTGNAKTDFRAQCIEAEIIDSKAPRGAEFRVFTPLMTEYCIQDTNTNRDTFLELIPELETYKGWLKGLKMETKLADLAVRRESFGFAFDKKLAIECLEDLGAKMQKIEDSINPILPPKKMGKTELGKYTLPKIQFKKDGSPSAALVNAVERLGGFLNKDGAKTTLLFEDKLFTLPYHEPLKTYIPATIKDLDHIKMFLISLGWDPLEWRERDLTKDAKKQPISVEKREKALERWVEETKDGKYKEARLRFLGVSEHGLYEQFENRILDKWPVRVPTSPMVRVGVEKELCPNLVKLGDKVAFASDFALYLTYKHRRSCIAGGEIEDMDFDLEYPNTGYLSSYREEDGRIPTPSIEIGASCVTEETQILTKEGFKPILEVGKGDEVFTHNSRFQPVTDFINNGVKPVYEIELESGHVLKCTGNHPLMTQRGWVRLIDLRESDEVVYVTDKLFKNALSKIKKISLLGDLPTFDLTVEKDHSYVANSIVTHNTSRYRHIGVANIARTSSIYGDKMRALFGCGEGFVQLGFDYASLENRVQAGYVKKYPGGEEMGVDLMAEKPNDLHTKNSIKMNISRTDAKSVGYGATYGAGGPKLGKMLGKSKEEGQQIHDDYWKAVPALKALKDAVTKYWEATGKEFIPGIDGRKLRVRSPHSILNMLFQSAGVICAKYATVYLNQLLEEKGFCTDPFIGRPDVCSMIEYHDEQALACNPKLFIFKTFSSEDEAKQFVDEWEGPGQLSSIREGKKWFVALPNDISLSIEKAAARVENDLKLQFKLGFEWIVGNNWAECH